MNNETHRITAIALSCYYNMMADRIIVLRVDPSASNLATIEGIKTEMNLTLVAYEEQTGQSMF